MPGTLSRLADQMFRAYRVCIWCAAAMFIVGCSSPAASRAPAADVLPTRTGCKLGTVTGRVTWPAGFETEFADPLMQVWLENTETGEATVLPLDPGRWSYSAQVAPGTYLVYAWLPGWRHIGMPEPVAEGSDHPVQPAVRVQAGNIEEAPQIERWETVEGSILALCGRVIDGTGTEPVADGVLVIRQERIMAVGPRVHVGIPAGAEIIELPGNTILPGFINAHVHNTYRERNRRIWAHQGVTTVRDLGERLGVDWFPLRDRLNEDPALAHAVVVGPLVTVPGGYPIAGNDFPSLTVDSPEDARREIAELIDDGADAIKITLTFGGAPTLSLEEARAIVETAHGAGVPVTVHATMAQALQRALDAGVDDIAHIVTDRLSDSLIQRMVSEGVAWVPTFEALDGHGLDNLKRFVTAGGIVALGNDSGYLSGLELGMPLREIRWMEKAGMTPMQIVVSGTRNAAFVCRRDGLLGTLEAGKLADVLVVDGDPLRDLSTLAQTKLVIHRGTIIRDER